MSARFRYLDFRAKVVKKVTRVLPALLPLGCGRKKEKVFAHHLQGCKKLLFYDPCVEQALADGGRFVARNGVKKKRDCNFVSRTLRVFFSSST